MARHIQRLFSYNPPPRRDGLIDTLFVDREAEFADAVDFLTAEGGFDPHIYAIHGDSRTGKSHLARRVLNALERHFTVVEITANSKNTARMALESIFITLYGELDALPESVEGPDGLQAEDVLLPWRAWFRQLLPLIEGHQKKLEVKVSRAVHEAVTSRVGHRLAHLQFARTEVDASERTVTIERPDDMTLARYVRQMTDVMWYVRGHRPVLIYVDDLDLLTRRDDGVSQQKADELTALLEPVSASERVVVMASIRSLYFGKRDKAFKDYLRVRRLRPELLREIYTRHVDALHDGEPVFTAPCLDRLLRLADGRVGVFLKHCYGLWRFAGRQVPIDAQTCHAWLEDALRELMRNPDTAKAMLTVGQWLVRGETAGPLPGVDPEDGPLAFLVVRPSALANDDRVDVVPENVEMIRRLVTAARP